MQSCTITSPLYVPVPRHSSQCTFLQMIYTVGNQHTAGDGHRPEDAKATRATPWLTGEGAVGHIRIRWTVEAHVAAQELEIAIGFGTREFISGKQQTLPRTTNFELRTVTRTLRFNYPRRRPPRCRDPPRHALRQQQQDGGKTDVLCHQTAPPQCSASKMSPRISTGPEPVLSAHTPSPPEREYVVYWYSIQ